MDWNLLKTFHKIVTAGGISRASQATGRRQPAISLALKRLEEQIGARLCERGPGGFQLTTEGEVVADICRRIFGIVEDIPARVMDAGKQVRGPVRVRLISSVNVGPLDEAIRLLNLSHPGIELKLTVSGWEDLTNLLLRNELDIGIGPAHFMHGQLKYSLLCKEVQRIYCGASHSLFGTKVSTLSELREYPFILKTPGEPEEVMRFRMQHGLGYQVAGTSDHVDEMLRLTRAGTGLALLPVGAAESDVRSKRLWCVTPGLNGPSLPIYTITNANAAPYRARDMFLQEIMKCSGQ
ncbi:LysR family transcriptional regulator [Roseovarius pelagicus]|uniref:LysR family transcriptional regulator n=1 Tax=Roseovarius pelagicus TaxID=2980108 RepID=A0ABY6DF57_9RHOB|nr:LysR family transcriptional regulator [Roseovarius pelagicus]UXX84787.1 LysR family transcriptional regulator [Roseovarius pelagicus]